MLDVLCGVLLLGIGYYIGLKQRPKAEAQPMTFEEKKSRKESQRAVGKAA